MTDLPTTSSLPDAQGGNWVDTLAPAAARPYLRLARIDRPIGWQLLFMPCLWSSALVSVAMPGMPANIWHISLFAVGAILARGAGSTFNDIVDRDLDAQVARTRGRPLPSGALTRFQAALFMAALALGGLLVLLQFNRFSVWLGIGSLVLVAVYPFMKRLTSMPQGVLGLTFAWGGLMGWAAALGRLDLPAFLIYGAAVLWTVGYDTIYAMQDLEDDEVAGIRSSARLFGNRTQEAVGVLYSGSALLVILALWWVSAGPVAYAAAFGFSLHLAWQVRAIAGADPKAALRLFRSNRHAGLFLGAGLALAGWLGAV